MTPRSFRDPYERLGALHTHAMMLRHTLGDLSPEDVADILAMAGITVGKRTGAAAAARDAALRACVDRLEATWAPPRAPATARPLLLRVETSIIHPCPARVGDRFLIQPDSARPVLLLRDAPANFGALVSHLGTGAISTTDGDSRAIAANLARLADRSREPTP
jgi:hypothetical protein